MKGTAPHCSPLLLPLGGAAGAVVSSSAERYACHTGGGCEATMAWSCSSAAHTFTSSALRMRTHQGLGLIGLSAQGHARDSEFRVKP